MSRKIRTDCYTINKHYKLDKEKVKKAFEIILSIKDKKEEGENKHHED